MLIEVQRVANVLMNCISPCVESLHSFPADGKQKTAEPGSLCGDSLEISWYFTAFCLQVSVACAEGTTGMVGFLEVLVESTWGWCHPLSSSLGLGM